MSATKRCLEFLKTASVKEIEERLVGLRAVLTIERNPMIRSSIKARIELCERRLKIGNAV